jgi:superoxide dismutase, Fe-Mn family
MMLHASVIGACAGDVLSPWFPAEAQGYAGTALVLKLISESFREVAMNRRDILKIVAGATALAAAAAEGDAARAQSAQGAAHGAFTLPPLGYANDALEPHIDAKTMQIHHDNHHGAYVNNLNGLVEKWPGLATTPIEDILTNLSVAPEAVRTAVRNNLGGHWNHSFFWVLMTPGGANAPNGELKSAIDAAFGDVAGMKAAVKTAGLGRFGSGWAWLAVGKDKKLSVLSTANQDTPHMEQGAKPVIGVDVWEHAYYLKHQYRRGDYIDAWWNVVNWDKAAANFKAATL